MVASSQMKGTMNRDGESGRGRKFRQETNEFDVGSPEFKAPVNIYGEMVNSRVEMRCGPQGEGWTWASA